MSYKLALVILTVCIAMANAAQPYTYTLNSVQNPYTYTYTKRFGKEFEILKSSQNDLFFYNYRFDVGIRPYNFMFGQLRAM